MTGLRLLWAGPWHAAAPEARLGAAVLAAWAAAGHRVEVARTESGAAALHPSLAAPGPVHSAAVMQPELTGGGYDAVFAVLTDDPEQSLWAPWIMAQAPAVMLLHAPALDRLAAACAEPGPHAPPEPVSLRRLAETALMLVAQDAAALAAADDGCVGSTLLLPAPAAPLMLPPMPAGPTRLIASVGDPAAPDGVGDVIRALAALPAMRGQVSHRVLGAIPPDAQDRLVRLARHLGAPVPIFVGDGEAKQAALAQAQLICWLADLDDDVAALAARRPLIRVGNPPNGPAAMRHCPRHEPSRLAHLLQNGEDDPAGIAALMRGAANWLATAHPVAGYARRLLAQVDAAIPGTAAVQAGMRIRDHLRALGLPYSGAAVAHASRGLAVSPASSTSNA